MRICSLCLLNPTTVTRLAYSVIQYSHGILTSYIDMVSYLFVDIGVIWLMIISQFVCGQYRLFWTDIINSNDLQLQHYCLYRHKPLTVETSKRVHEIIPYCISNRSDFSSVNEYGFS